MLINERTFAELVVASGNPHKLEEIRAVFDQMDVRVLGLDALGQPFPEPEETAMTFSGNARLKALAYATMTGRLCLADDSGLEVDALGGAPGVFSARFAGVDGSRSERDAANNRLLVERLRGIPAEQRGARFVCAMCLATPDGRVLAETRGEFAGVIVDEPRGNNGFGYDPHLYLPDERRTSAELSPDEKNARSHRGQATRSMAARMKEQSVVQSLT
ncbi:MAG: RdgB/HAM1 family non-canonical purine NTP pyrophosphatase [Phycisphaerae bacterium]|nr:RdgB/HAM1 family non-canonical purine NTP pyrophosphatase [Phycisphaerae bacterium]